MVDAPPEAGGPGLLAEASRPSAAGYGPHRQAVEPAAFWGEPHARRCGVTSAPRDRRPRCKRRPWLSAGGLRGWGRGLAWVWGIAGVGLGTPKGRMSAGGRSLGARSGGNCGGDAGGGSARRRRRRDDGGPQTLPSQFLPAPKLEGPEAQSPWSRLQRLAL